MTFYSSDTAVDSPLVQKIKNLPKTEGKWNNVTNSLHFG